MLVFRLPAYAELANALCKQYGFDAGVYEYRQFPDGEHYHRLVSLCTDRDVVLIGSTWNDTDTMALYDLATGIANNGARTLIVVIPFFGYGTMERAVRSGEVVKAKVRARLFSSLPQPQRGTRILLMDLHADGIPHYFESPVRAIHLYAKPIVLQAARDLAQGNDFVLGSTDAGRAKWVESLAQDLGVLPAFVYKQRVSGSETKVTGVNADVRNKHVVIYDDMVRTGASLLAAAEAYRNAGAVQVSAICTHLICPNDSLERIQQAGIIDRLVGTDTHPHAAALQERGSGFLEVRSVVPVFGDYLAGIRK
jgi:ribose-phosphate pyrophosphokinase